MKHNLNVRNQHPKQLSSEAGFSLIELMVVVAIIGVLSSIAVPNYQLMVARARQSEAKQALSTLYAAQHGFAAEYNVFTMCNAQAGYEPQGSRIFYLTGTYGGGNASTWVAPSGTCSGAYVVTNGYGHNDSSFLMNTWANPAISGAIPQNTNWGVNTFDTFTMVAIGSIMPSSPIYDIWTIDQSKRLSNIQSGL